MNSETLSITSHVGDEIVHRLYQPEKRNNRLLVLIPGRGYLVSHTHLHLTQMLGLQLGYAVLPLQYGFQVKQVALDMQHLPDLKVEVEAAVRQALTRKAYDEIVLVGKSLGTPIAAQLANELPQVARTILLTPITGSTELMGTVPTLAIIGTADALYHDDLIQDSETLRWKVYPGVNHGLLLENDVRGSVQILAEIMHEIENFLSYSPG